MFKKKKISRGSLFELAKRMPTLNEKVQATLVGGGNGTRENPFSLSEYMDLGDLFQTGWVDLPDSISYLTCPYSVYYSSSGLDDMSGYDNNNGTGFLDESGNYTNLDSGIEYDDSCNCKTSCVFNCFTYLSGDIFDTCYFYYMTKSRLGYEPTADGGVLTSDIPTIGSFCGFDVQELSDGVCLKTDGTLNGIPVMMTFNQGNIDHAVIVTGCSNSNGNAVLSYHDPTTGKNGEIESQNITGLYSVGILYLAN